MQSPDDRVYADTSFLEVYDVGHRLIEINCLLCI